MVAEQQDEKVRRSRGVDGAAVAGGRVEEVHLLEFVGGQVGEFVDGVRGAAAAGVELLDALDVVLEVREA